MVNFGKFLSNSVTRQVNFDRKKKLVPTANTKIEKFKYDIFDDFQTLWNFSLGKKGQMRHFKEFSNALNILFADLISSSKCLSSISIPHTFNLD